MAFKKKLELNSDKTVAIGGNGNPSELQGYFMGSKTVDTDFGPGILHYFQTSEGVVATWGKAHLNRLLTADHAGQMCIVSFAGMRAPTKKGRKPSYQFELQYDPEDTIDVTGIVVAGNNEESDEVGVDEVESDLDSPDTEVFDQPVHVQPQVATRTVGKLPSAESLAKARSLMKNTRTA